MKGIKPIGIWGWFTFNCPCHFPFLCSMAFTLNQSNLREIGLMGKWSSDRDPIWNNIQNYFKSPERTHSLIFLSEPIASITIFTPGSSQRFWAMMETNKILFENSLHTNVLSRQWLVFKSILCKPCMLVLCFHLQQCNSPTIWFPYIWDMNQMKRIS